MSQIIYPVPGVYDNSKDVDVSVIVPLYNSRNVIRDQIRRYTTDDNLVVETIYVDDRCPQQSKKDVFRRWNQRPDKSNPNHIVKLICSLQNRGFGGACNLGAHYAQGRILVFLNADATTTPYWLSPMVDVLKDPTIGIVGNLHIKEGGVLHGTIDSAGSEWSWEHVNFLHMGRHVYHGELLDRPFLFDEAPEDLLQESEREMVTGCCFAIRRSLFEEIGGFHQHYRIGYWEDSEMCCTVREMGYRIVYTPKSVIYHKLAHSELGGHNFHQWNKEYFFNKWVDNGRIDKLVAGNRLVPASTVSNILVRRMDARGDVLMAAAVVPAIRRQFPQAEIYFATKCPEVLEGNPYIDHVISSSQIHSHIFQLRYNLDLAYERRPHTNILQAYADEAGVSVKDCQMYIKIDENIPYDYPDQFAVIHAGATNWVGRDWEPDRFCTIAEAIRTKGIPVVCVGKGGDHLVPCDADLRDKLTIQQLAAVIFQAKFFVGIDSLPFHIAQAAHTPGAAFFGCIKPETRIVNKNMHGFCVQGLQCLGCHHRKLPPATATTKCETGKLDCIKLPAVTAWEERIKDLCNQNA